MGSYVTEAGEQEQLTGTPEDVAALYQWANMQGARYRDFSGSRREHRAQVRHRAAVELRERELQAQATAEASAAEADREALAAESDFQEISETPEFHGGQDLRIQSMRNANAAAKRAAAYRTEAAHHAETAAQVAVAILREEREIVDARASAQRQAQNYAASGPRQGQLAGPQPIDFHAKQAGAGAVSLLPGFNFKAYGTDVSASEGPSAESFFALDLSRNAAGLRSPREIDAGEAPAVVVAADAGTATEQSGPAWLYPSHTTTYATPRAPAIHALPPREVRTPLLAIFSFAGGVSKSGVVATLSRALGVQGERVVLADTTSHGLLPFYFGARELEPGLVRTFPAASSGVKPLSLVSYDIYEESERQQQRDELVEEILRNCDTSDRVVLDISSGSHWLLRRIVDLHPVVLVPIALDANSIITMQAIERLFNGILDSDGQPLRPCYLLNQFDVSNALHLDIRESLRRWLRDRLLPFSIRRSPAINEALAEGMTVLDYTPDAPISRDYLEVAAWLKSVSPPVTGETLKASGSAP
jgi:cellulose synthase operon protein YhjQ